MLVARLRALLRRGAAARPAVLQVGGLRLDLGRRIAARSMATTVELTPREFSVLEYLMRRPGEVVPKSEILAHVWDFAFDGDDNVVEVHVSALRRKLGAGAIDTVRGAGYRVVAACVAADGRFGLRARVTAGATVILAAALLVAGVIGERGCCTGR